MKFTGIVPLFFCLLVCAGEQMLVESIRYNGLTRTGSGVLRNQLLLEEGKTYSAKQLEHAVRRLARLPFIHSADYRLESGQGNGKELIITLRENQWVTAELGTNWFDQSEQNNTSSTDNLTMNGNYFVGKSMVIHAAARPDVSWTQDFDKTASLSTGVSHYDLFGIGLEADWNITFREDTTLDFPQDSLVSYDFEPNHALSLAWPFTINQSITAGYDTTSEDVTQWWPDGKTRESRNNNKRAFLGWRYNSTDEEKNPTTGLAGSIQLQLSQSKTTPNYFLDQSTVLDADNISYNNNNGITMWLRNHNRINPKTTIYYGGQAGRSNNELTDGLSRIPRFEVTQQYLAAELGSMWDLWSGRSAGFGDLRFIVEGFAAINEQDTPHGKFDINSYGLMGGLSLVNEWGRMRLTYSWIDQDS